jgi:mRNA-degrading endonuclease RelE of RelBE toxin-antitoxin system
MNSVYETETFSKLYEAAEKREQEWIEKIKDQLTENLRVGKPLRFDWLREKRLGNKRLFFLINDSTNKAVLVAFGSKKGQQKLIDHIILDKEQYLRFVS